MIGERMLDEIAWPGRAMAGTTRIRGAGSPSNPGIRSKNHILSTKKNKYFTFY